MSDTSTTARSRGLSRVGGDIGLRVESLQRKAMDRSPSARAALAELRRAVSDEPGTNPGAWEWTQVAVPENVGDSPTWDEMAAHLAMTLYATHQQSRSEPMHRTGSGFGAAMRKLVFADGSEENPAARARFNTLVTATTISELRTHLRSVIGLLRQRGIPLDYGMLADDLAQFQRPGGANIVRRRWSRQYYYIHQSESSATETTTKEQS